MHTRQILYHKPSKMKYNDFVRKMNVLNKINNSLYNKVWKKAEKRSKGALPYF